MKLLESYSWPGNVRQLENTVFRAVVLCDSDTLDVPDFPQIASAMGMTLHERKQASTTLGAPLMPAAQPSHAAPKSTAPFGLSATDIAGHMRRLEEIEAEIIRMAIARYDGRMSEVARRLGIGRSTLYRKLKDLGLDHDEEAVDNEDETPEPKVATGG